MSCHRCFRGPLGFGIVTAAFWAMGCGAQRSPETIDVGPPLTASKGAKRTDRKAPPSRLAVTMDKLEKQARNKSEPNEPGVIPIVAAPPQPGGPPQSSPNGHAVPVPPASVARVGRPWTPDELMRLHAMILPGKGEAVWQTIPWFTDLREARIRAAVEGKPILVWSASADPIGTI